MTYAEFKTNFLPEFLNIKSFNGRIKYANQYLQRIGSGSGRIVYDIDGEKVLKLAKNPKGIAQNEVEAGAGYYNENHHILTKVIYSPDDDSWLIAEKAKRVNEARIKQLTGIPSLNDLRAFLKNVEEVSRGHKKIFHQDPKLEEYFWDENEFAYSLADFVANYNQNAGDMGRPSTFGEVMRNGKPDIVLTDYGLNDEVTDSFYSGKKQQYRMYELYDFQDGNDDMLGDLPPQDGIDTRNGMWSMMPYGVGDGPGVINEKFVSFIENRNKYPETGVLPSTPYILDEFHDIVNNLKEVLNHVSNKKKFYNNLLELQNYLIRGKFWDREPLQREEYVINEGLGVEAHQLSREVADEFANSISEKLNLGMPKYLGGGGNGVAYAINNNKVLKITTDACEVDAGLKISRSKPKTLAMVYNVYKVINTVKNIAVYVLVEDNIVDKPQNKFIEYTNIINSLGEDLYGRLLGILVKGKPRKDDSEFAGKTINDFPELAKLILTTNPNANINVGDRENAYRFMMGLYEIKLELQKLMIKSNDYMTLANLGYKNGILTYFDIGGCVVAEPELSPENQITLPETEELLKEDVNGFPKEVADKVANVVAQKFNYGQPKLLGNGVFGYAYDIGNNLVLKVTKDNSEANENLQLIGKPLEYIAQPYKVFSIKSNALSGKTSNELYVIILEKLRTDAPDFIARVKRMEFAFGKIMNVNYDDVLDHYIHGAQLDDGINESKIEKYFARNPQDKEFFEKILKIGKEVKKYGLESVDYSNPKNLGYKSNGNLGFFDVGAGNFNFYPDIMSEPIQVDEDGSALYATPNSFGQDNFPVYNNNDSSPLTDNNVPPLDEDLEYNYVVGDATTDEFQITEVRDKSFAGGSQSVEVKQKCRLAGNGNTSTACNQGDISNLNFSSIKESISDEINEVINGNEAIGDDKALESVLKDRRNICFIELNPKNVKIIEKNGFGVLPTRMTSQNTMMAIVFKNIAKNDALKLYNISKLHDGYLADNTPEEAREIGRLLGYTEESIEGYIRKHEKRYGKVIPRAPEPEDYNDLDETAGELDKYYVRPGIYDEDDRDVIMSITNGDNFTKLIADMYYYLTNRYNKEMVEPTRLSERDRQILVNTHELLKGYDKNVFPIHDLYAREHNAHPLEKVNDLSLRKNIINVIKSFPSIYLRNLRGDIRIERNHYEFEKLFQNIQEIDKSLKLIKRLNPQHQEKIMKKVFSSANDSFEGISNRLKNTTIPYLSQEEGPEGIIEKINDVGDEAEILYNKNNILVVKINTGEAMGYIGCSSQWCFASNPQGYWDDYTSADGFATIVFNFNEEPSEPTAMVVVLETGEVYDMYNNHMEDGDRYLQDLGIAKYVLGGEMVNMDEQEFPASIPQIEKDNITHKLDKNLIRTYSDGIDVNPVYAVNGDEVRDSGFIEWVEGGNHWVDADLPEDEQKYAKHIPADELWVDDVHLSKPNDFEAILLHERTESYLIKHFSYVYNKAHEIANKIELLYREKTHGISDEIESERIASVMYAAFKKNFRPKGGKTFKNEGVADVAAERQFGIQQPHQGFEDKFLRDQQEDVVYSDPNSGLVIIRNPKRLESIFGYARGVIDPEGNLYIEQRPTGIHYDMLYALNCIGLVEDEEDWDMKLPHNFVTVQRYLRTNKILLGESNFSMIPDEIRKAEGYSGKIPSREVAEPIFQRFLDRAKQKTPIFEFINEILGSYIESLENNSIFETENQDMISEADIMSLQNLPFKQEVEQLGGKIYSVGGAVRDEFQITERVQSFQPGSKTVEIKKKCKLGGNGSTSTPCNQGDINNLTFGSIKESVSVNIPQKLGGYDSLKIVDNGQVVGSVGIMDRGIQGQNHYITIDKIFIEKEFRGKGYANDAMKLIFDYADRDKMIVTLTPDNTWGSSKSKLTSWYKSLGFIMNKGRNKDFQTMQLMYRLPNTPLTENFPASDSQIEKDLEKMGKLNDFVETLKEKPFIISLINDLKSDIYAVGGVVRDLILNKQNKDIDLIIRNVPIDTLISYLQKFGHVDVVGKSFGVIKFIDKDGIDYDLALPRKEQPTGEGGYRGFDVQSDENLPIEDDLIRRDIKMNAMAINVNTGKFIDPLGGLDDIEKKQISAANPNAFSDDPLRMIRIVGFASRFGFTIEPETMKMIRDNAGRVKEIAPERILTEFDKIIKKGNKSTGAFLLKDTGLLKNIFGADGGFLTGKNIWENVKTMGEFIWLLSHNLVDSPSEFYKNNLKGDIPTYKEIKAFETAFSADITNPVMARSIAHNMYLFSPESLNSKIIQQQLQVAAQELLQGKYPKTVNELAVNGNDLVGLGLQGKAIGDMQKSLLLKVYADKVRNNREDLLALAKQNGEMVKEEQVKPTDKIEYGCLMVFLDVPIWEKITSIISPDDVYDMPGYGIETEPHTTILYGFHDEVTSEDCFNLFKENMPVKPIKIGIKGISYFTGNPNFDVVKFDVESPELTELNEIMKALPHTSSFPDYHPHITIAYVKPGEGQKYVKPFEKNRMLNGTELVYTWKVHKGNDGDKLILNGRVDEGIADTAAERLFNVNNQSVVQDNIAKNAVLAGEEQPVGVVEDEMTHKRTSIYKNPKSLSNFGDNCRGIIDKDGNIFIAQKDGWFNHGDIGVALGFINEGDSMFYHLTEWMLINRVQDRDWFGLSDSAADFLEEGYEIVIDFLRKAKHRNPQYEYYPEYYNHVVGKPIKLNESSYKNMHEEPTWNVNGQTVDISFFVDKYYQWNQGGYESASEASVLEFLENNYEDFSNDEILKHDLYHKLVDNELLDEEEVKKDVRYTAVVLDDKSRTALLKRLGNMIPEGWETIAHHMTINLGPIDPIYERFLGMTANLTANSFAADDKVMAVGVSGFPTINKLPHITLAVNRTNGGKPMMSNNLTDWEPLSEPIVLTGKVTEVE